MTKKHEFKLVSKNKPSGDQPRAIKQLVDGLKQNVQNQVLLGVTGSGKTFTIANVIKNTKRATLILSHNKTLAAQLYSEFKELFPQNRVEYFVSYFDFYRPEAYLPRTDTYLDKTSKINWNLDAMRLSTFNALLSRKDTIVIASVAAIYGASNPKEYVSMIFPIEVGKEITRKQLIYELVKRNYNRNNFELEPSNFRANGDVIELAPAWADDYYIRIELFGDEIENIAKIDVLNGEVIEHYRNFTIYPANGYTTRQETMNRAIANIKIELEERVAELRSKNKLLEVQRLEQRVKYDIEALEEFNICPGIENYSMHIDGRDFEEQPYTLFDYIPSDALVVIDESHMTIPQIKGMYNGDRARKETLVEYGFRLPSALDNRPLRLDEFLEKDFQKIFVSATPNEFETDLSNGVVVEQIVRPTGLLDPIVEVSPSTNQIEDIIDRLKKQVAAKQRTFIITLTIRMAEELTRHLQLNKFRVAYLHNELKTLQRSEILRKLRKGIYDIVIGINLLKEGIDIPEISLVCVLDANKESFFRSTKALIQIIGRAARNKDGKVVLYGDTVSKSMKEAIEITANRRKLQKEYNLKYNIEPNTIIKPIASSIYTSDLDDAIDLVLKKRKKISKKAKDRLIDDLRSQMLKASKSLDFEKAAQIRDIIIELGE